MTAVDTHAEARAGRRIDRQVGVIESEIVKTTAVHPGVTPGEDVTEERRVWSSPIGEGASAVAGESEARKSRWALRRAGNAEGRAAKPLRVIEAYQ